MNAKSVRDNYVKSSDLEQIRSSSSVEQFKELSLINFGEDNVYECKMN